MLARNLTPATMIDILPTLFLLYPENTPAQIRVWNLVLHARGIPCLCTKDGLYVPEEKARSAFSEIEHYQAENVPRLPSQKAPQENSLGSLGILALFTALNGLISTRFFSVALLCEEHGRVLGRAVQQGQWWRAVTGLTLHANPGHLFSNMAALLILCPLVARRTGTGFCWLFFVLGGALGNALNAMLHGPQHASLGASTGVFALAGTLAALNLFPHTHILRVSIFLTGGFALGFLALLGTAGENTDIGAHVAGLVSGFFLGLLTGHFLRAVPNRISNICAGLLALCLVLGAWYLAFS